MPEISRFFGIVIRMYVNDHYPPHFHAVYGEFEALINIETLAVYRGDLRDVRSRWFWNGLRCIETSCDRTGTWRAMGALCNQLPHWSKVKEPMPLLRIQQAVPLEGFRLRLTLTDGSVVERDVSDLLAGPIFDPIRSDAARFREVRVEEGSVAWPNGAGPVS
jgi:hypothetical protein